MPCAVLLFFLTGLSFEIKRIIIAFWALVKREIKIFLKNFTGGGVRAPRPTGGYKRCGKTGRCRHRPLRVGTRSMVQDRAGRENPALQKEYGLGDQRAHWLRNDTSQEMRYKSGGRTEASAPTHLFRQNVVGAASPTPRFTERLAALRRGDPCGRPLTR